jgi:hypothetical protein
MLEPFSNHYQGNSQVFSYFVFVFDHFSSKLSSAKLVILQVAPYLLLNRAFFIFKIEVCDVITLESRLTFILISLRQSMSISFSKMRCKTRSFFCLLLPGVLFYFLIIKWHLVLRDGAKMDYTSVLTIDIIRLVVQNYSISGAGT